MDYDFANSNTESTGHIDTTSKSWYIWQPDATLRYESVEHNTMWYCLASGIIHKQLDFVEASQCINR